MAAYGILENGVVIARFVVPMTFRSNRPSFSSDTLSLKRNTLKRAAQRWELETRLEPLHGGANELFAHMVEHGDTEVFTIIAPQNPGVVKARTSVSAPVGVGAKGANQVVVTGNVGVIPRGTMIKFANHGKLYMTRNTLNGDGALGIYPELRLAVNGEFKHRDDVVMNCLYDTDVIKGMQFEDGILMDNGTIKIIERL